MSNQLAQFTFADEVSVTPELIPATTEQSVVSTEPTVTDDVSTETPVATPDAQVDTGSETIVETGSEVIVDTGSETVIDTGTSVISDVASIVDTGTVNTGDVSTGTKDTADTSAPITVSSFNGELNSGNITEL